MQQKLSSPPGIERFGVSLQLVLSHVLATGVVLVASVVLPQVGLSNTLVVCLSLLIGGAIGLLLNANLLSGLQTIERTLEQFVQLRPAERRKPGWLYWPLASLFVKCSALAERMKELARSEQLTTDYHEQLLRQVSESAALEERTRIARDLHDSIKQQIFSISVSAAAARAHAKGSSEDAEEALADIQQSAKEAQVEMQALLQQLRASPLEDTGLDEALRTQAQALGYRTGAEVQVEIAPLPPADRLPPGTQEAVFRIVQEAFANIARHARASHVRLTITIQQEALDTLTVEVRDDGQGFDTTTGHRGMGLGNLHTRAEALGGSMMIQSTPGQGTRLLAHIPLLMPLERQQEQEQRSLMIKHASEQAKNGFQLATNAVVMVLGVMVFGLVGNTAVWPLVGILWIVVFYGYLQGRFALGRVLFFADGAQDRETCGLWLQEQRVLLWVTRALLVGVWYLFLILHGWQGIVGDWAAAIGTVVVVLVLALERSLYTMKLDRYYKLLPREELQWEIERAATGFSRSLRLWGGVAIFVFFLGSKTLVLPPVTLSNWASIGDIVGMGVWGLILLSNYAHLRQWKRVLAMSRTEDTRKQAGGRSL